MQFKRVVEPFRLPVGATISFQEGQENRFLSRLYLIEAGVYQVNMPFDLKAGLVVAIDESHAKPFARYLEELHDPEPFQDPEDTGSIEYGILENSVADLTEAIQAIGSIAYLQGALEQEQAKEHPRKGAVKALEARIQELEESGSDEGAPEQLDPVQDFE